LLKKLQIKLDPSSSLAATVALGERPYSTFDKDRPSAVSLVDVQIAHILDSEGLLYVPMRIRNRHIGVMVYGITVSQHSRIQNRLDWMTSFAGLAATSIEAWREMRCNEQNIETSVTNRFKLHARKTAHEAGNPLSIIKNYLKIVTQKLSGENDVRLELDILREEIDRVSHILQRLDTLNEAAPEVGAIDINGVIEGMLSLYGDPLFSACGITVVKTLESSLPPVAGDRDSIKQVLLNIWKNATEAMTDGGRIVIATRGPVTKNGRSFVEIILSDSGPGLPQDVKQNLFQPLEQGRRPGHSGLGLSIIETLVEKLEGSITCQSDPGQGTIFRILLPCSDRKEH
jgi:nitrogen-specific signal transduction histidine kinase